MIIYLKYFFQGPIELVNVEPQYLPYVTRNETRFVEMLVSCDHRMVIKLQSQQFFNRNV